MGDALLQKTYTIDFLLKKRVVNNGIVPQYYDIDKKMDELQNEILRFAELNAEAGADSNKYDKEYEKIASTIHDLR